MTTLPNTGTVLPTRGTPGSGVWGDSIDAALQNYDSHSHQPGHGLPINTAAIAIDSNLSFNTLAAEHLARITFDAVTALSSNNKSIFVNSSDNELYWRNNSGTNVKLTSGSALNVAAFAGGIGGDYASVGAAVAFDDANDRYTFKQQGGVWARMASGEVRILETGTSESLYVGLVCPAALAGSYAITFPLAAPASTRNVSIDSTGQLSFSDSHGDRTLTVSGADANANSNVSYTSAIGATTTTGAATIVIAIPLRVGDRIKSVAFYYIGDNAVDVSSVDVLVNDTSAVTVIGTSSITNAPAAGATLTIDVTDTTITSTMTLYASLVVLAANFALHQVRATYDHP